METSKGILARLTSLATAPLAAISVKDPLRLVVSLALIVGMLTLSTNFTNAAFLAQDGIYGNTISTASIDLDVEAGASGVKPFNIPTMMPGDESEWGDMWIYNIGDEELEAYLTLTKTDGDDALYEALHIQMKFADNQVCNDGEGDDYFYNGSIAEFPDGFNLGSSEGPGAWLWGVEGDNSPEDGPYDNLIDDENKPMVICQRVLLPEDATDVGGMSVTFDEIVNAYTDDD